MPYIQTTIIPVCDIKMASGKQKFIISGSFGSASRPTTGQVWPRGIKL